MNTTTTGKVTEYRVRARCNTCFKFSWATVAAGYNINHITCGRCGAQDAVGCKFIEIKAENPEGRACAGPCQSSKSGDCECSCGGKNHGVCA